MFGIFTTYRNKKKIHRLFELLNKRNFEELKELLHPEIKMELLSIMQAEIIVEEGIDNVYSTIKNTANKSDAIHEVTEIFVSSSNRLLARLKFSATKWEFYGGYELDEYLEEDFIYIIEFKDGKIFKMEQLRDRLKMLQKVGRAAIIQDDPKLIQNYINKIINAKVESKDS